MQQLCAICCQRKEEPSPTKTVLGLRTADAGLLRAAITHYGRAEGDLHHILLPVCPAHAVDVYRGRVHGVEMAWRVPGSSQPQIAPR